MAQQDSKSEFDAFVRAQQKNAQPDVDWKKERDDWLAYLDSLYKEITTLLGEYIQSDQVLVRYHDVLLNEEGIGQYKARRLIIKIGGKEIVLEPIGTLLVGTKGRVDVTGPAGKTRFMLVDKDAIRPSFRVATTSSQKGPQWIWKIVTSPPNIQYIELTRDSLFRALMEVSGG